MDIQMPEMDGFEATHLIRQQNTTIPIITLTAHVIQEEVEHFKQAGFDNYVAKPFAPGELQEKLIHFLPPHPNAPKEPSYSTDYIAQMIGGDKQQIRQMEMLFVKQSEEAIQQMSEYVSQQSWKQIGALAHKIK